jgi:hypothetical protein
MRWGLTGVLLFAIGVLFLLLAIYVQMSGGEQFTVGITGFVFIGLLIGIGLVLIFKRKIESFLEK